MALRTLQGVTIKGEVPPNFQDVCTLRLLQAKFGPNSKKNPMFTFEWEILFPPEVSVEGKSYAIAGQKIMSYYVLKTFKNGKLEDDNVGKFINSIMPKLGLPKEIDDEQPNIEQFKNICVDATLRSIQDVMQRINQETGDYEAVKNPATGEAVIKGCRWDNGFNFYDNIIGLTIRTDLPPW